MKVFGGYEVAIELSRTPFGAVYSAKPAGAQGRPEFLVKTFNPEGLPEDRLAGDPQIAEFLERAEVQRKAAQPPSTHWAPILETGIAPEGAFYVSRFYPSSAHRLFLGKVRLDAAMLHAIASGVVEGLDELKRACGQSHGNLRTTTVLLSRPDRGGSTQVALAEPLTAASARGGEAEDLRALGELIFQLVTHRNFSAVGGWPIQDGPEWRNLGRRGQAWRELCNRLVDPAPREPLTLDGVRRDLRELRIRRSPVSPLAVAAVLVLLLLASGIVAFLQYNRWAADWRQYCDAYANWFRCFDTGRDEPVFTDARTRMKEDPYLLQHVLTPVGSAADIIFSPRERFGDRTIPLVEQGRHVPLSFEAARHTRQALEVVRQVRRAFEPDAWPALQQVIRFEALCRQRQWTAAADRLARLAHPLAQSDPQSFAAAVCDIVGVAPALSQLQSLSDRIQQHAAVLERTGDAVLVQYPQFAESRTRSAEGDDPLAALIARLGEVEQLGQKLVAFVSGPQYAATDRALFEKRSEVHTRTGMDLGQRMEGWLLEVVKYPLDTTPDPRQTWDAPARLARLQSQTARLRKIHADNAKLPADALPPLLARVDALAARLAELTNLTAMPWNAESRPRIENAQVQINLELARLDGEVRSAIEDADRWLREQAAAEQLDFQEALSLLQARKLAVGIDSPPPELERLWQQARDQIAKSATSQQDLPAVRSRLDQAHATFVKLVEELPPPPDFPPQRAWNTQVAAIFRGQADARRLSMLQEAAAALRLADGMPVRDAAFEAAWRSLRDQYAAWAAGAVDFIHQLNVVEDLLDLAYGSDEEPTGAQSIAAIVGRFEPTLKDQEVRKAVAAIIDRVNQLKAAEGSSNRNELEKLAASSPHPEVARAAWRRLRQLTPAWPASADELRREAALHRRLNTALELIRVAERRKQVLAEVAAAGEASLRTALAAAADEAGVAQAFAAALEVKEALGVGRAGQLTAAEMDQLQLDPRLRYNYFLYRWRTSVAALSSLDDAAAKKRIEQIIAELPAGSSPPAQQQLAQRLDELLKDSGADAGPPADAGPAASPLRNMVAWQPAGGPNPMLFTWEYQGRRHSLVFHRIDPSPGEPSTVAGPFYLSATEISVGLFRDVMLAAGRSRADMGLPDTRPEDTNFPRVWRLADGGIEVNDYWLPRDPQYDPYPPALHAGSTSDRRDPRRLLKDPQGNPSPDHPMQYLPAHSAMTFAAMLGCRLPTSEEWRRALPLARDTPNLRDATWQIQRQWIAEQRAARRTRAPWPDAGMFIPAGVAGLPQEDKATVWTAAPPLAPAISFAPDDGALWFRPVGDGQDFAHLVGNVAEFVWDDLDRWDKLPGRTVDDIRAMVKAGSASLFVVGGSAISAPQIGIDRQSVEPFRALNAYADVGFRLAFAAGKRSLLDRLKELFAEQRYVLPQT